MLSKKPVLFHLTKKNGSCHFVEPALEQMVNKFWELDSFEKETVITQDDALCERIFVDRYKRSKTLIQVPLERVPTGALKRFLHRKPILRRI
jgi:hypothetical protein